MQSPVPREAHNASLAYFGRLAADISHELRNRFATINEKDGLLTDLLELQRRGRPADPERLVSLSGDIKRHVRLAQETCTDLSLFSHLADEEVREENIDDLVALMSRLTARRGRQHGLEIVSRTRAHVSARVNPFQLGFAIFQCLDWALKSQESGELELSALRARSGPGVEIQGADFAPLISQVPDLLDATLLAVPGVLAAGENSHSVVITIEEAPR